MTSEAEGYLPLGKYAVICAHSDHIRHHTTAPILRSDHDTYRDALTNKQIHESTTGHECFIFTRLMQ